ncbi:MAG: polysaccharide biosynthesis protein, partial [Marinobacter sp.]
VVFTGLRPGEKLFEELLIGDDPQGTSHPRIMMAREVSMQREDLEIVLDKLRRASQEFDCKQIIETLKSAPTGFTPNGNLADLVWCNGGSDITVTHENAGKVHRLPV